jgi:hypothetical protein
MHADASANHPFFVAERSGVAGGLAGLVRSHECCSGLRAFGYGCWDTHYGKPTVALLENRLQLVMWTGTNKKGRSWQFG